MSILSLSRIFQGSEIDNVFAFSSDTRYSAPRLSRYNRIDSENETVSEFEIFKCILKLNQFCGSITFFKRIYQT